MYCHNCGKEIFDDAEFCQYCGCNLKKELLKELEAEVEVEDPPIAVKVSSAKEINQEESDKAINTDEQAKKLKYGYLNYKELSNRLTDIENISLEYLKLLNFIITKPAWVITLCCKFFPIP